MLVCPPVIILYKVGNHGTVHVPSSTVVGVKAHVFTQTIRVKVVKLANNCLPHFLHP